MMRWSNVRQMFIIERMAIASSMMTGRLTMDSVFKMAACGWLMMPFSHDRAERPGVVYGEGSPLHVCYVELGCPCLGREAVNGLGKFGDAELVGVRDDGDEEALLGRDCHSEVDVSFQYDGIVRPS